MDGGLFDSEEAKVRIAKLIKQGLPIGHQVAILNKESKSLMYLSYQCVVINIKLSTGMRITILMQLSASTNL